MKTASILLSVALLFTACSTTTENTTPVATKAPIATVAKTTTNPPTTTRAPVIVTTTRTPATTTTAVTCSIDFEVREQIREWNRISGQMLASYMDMSISVDQVVSDFENLSPKLTRVVREMRSLGDCLPSDESKFFAPFLATYNDKLSGYSALENSMRIDSPELEQTALEMLTNANNASLGMVCEIADFLGEKLPGAELC